MFAGNFAPVGWMLCQGQLLPISQYETLFNLIGTTYGGDGQSTFALPNLQSRVPIHQGPGFVIGQAAGEETVTLTTNQIPSHSHVALAYNGNGNQAGPGGGVWASSNLNQFTATAPSTQMSAQLIGSSGGSQPHDNMLPFLVVNFIISLFGVFPSQN
jgi:microcystin-dependent protein